MIRSGLGTRISFWEALEEDAQQNVMDLLNDVPGARGEGHALQGRMVVGSEASAELDPSHKAAINARGGYGTRKLLEETERLRKHELTVSHHMKLGVFQDMKSLAESMKNGQMSDLQVAQKLMSSVGVPQIARLSDIVRFSIGGEGTREEREEQLAQFQALADKGELDTSTIRGYIGGLDQLLELGGSSIVAAAGNLDMSPEDQDQVLKVAFELRRSLAGIEITTGGVSQGMKRDRVSLFQEAILNGHPPSVETEVKVFKVLSDAHTLFPQLMEMLTIGTEPVKALAIKTFAAFGGFGSGGEQEGDVIRSAMDATIQAGGGVQAGGRESFLQGVTPQELTGTELQAGMGDKFSLVPGASKNPVARGLEVAAGVAGGPVVGGLGTLLETGASRLFGGEEETGRPSTKTRQQRLNEFTKNVKARKLRSTAANQPGGKNLLSEVAQEAFQAGLLREATMRVIGGRIDRGDLTGKELLALIRGTKG